MILKQTTDSYVLNIFEMVYDNGVSHPLLMSAYIGI